MLLNENLANSKNVATPHGLINFNEKEIGRAHV